MLQKQYEDIKIYIQAELLEMEAMTQAIDSLTNLIEKKESISAKHSSLTQFLSDTKSGKTTLKTIFSFSFKSKRDDIIKIEEEINSLQLEKELLAQLACYSSFSLHSIKELFEKERLENYYQLLSHFGNFQLTYLDQIVLD
jgi:hypothetical protein